MTQPTSLRPAVWLAGVSLSLAVAAQEPAAPPNPAESTPPSTAIAPGTVAATEQQIEAWIRDLGNDSFRRRTHAETNLRQLGTAAVKALQQAAKDSDDHEVQWRARRLLRQIESGQGDEAGTGDLRRKDSRREADAAPPQDRPGQRGMGRFGLPGAVPEDLRSQFDQMFERMEQDLGLDIPRMRFFQNDFFRDLQQQVQGMPGARQGMSMQIGPDGKVKVEVERRNEQGEIDRQVYEAPDLETLHREHPDLLGPGAGGGGLQWFFGDRRAGGFRNFLPLPLRPEGERLLPRLQPRWRAEAPGASAEGAAADGPRLGIYVRAEIPLELRQYLELTDGQGLMVEAVQSDSLAQQLGLREGDIVLRIGDQTIGTAEDVQRALGKISAGGDVAVKFLRKGAERSATAKLPGQAAKPDHDVGKEGGRLRRRDR